MLKNLILPLTYILVYCLAQTACTEQDTAKVSVQAPKEAKPLVVDNGNEIRFQEPTNAFSVVSCGRNSTLGNIEAPAKVVASVFKPENQQAQNIILFENPEITELYTTMLQSMAHLARDTDFYDRNLDMYKNGAATGKDVLEAKTGMIEAATELAEKEARLRTFGFKPQELRNAPTGIVWLFANVSEGDLNNITTGKDCKIEFISYS
ncbi:MAG: hypothetical protein ACOVQA_03875, partial [Thermoflexibacteraceae bacterium]